MIEMQEQSPTEGAWRTAVVVFQHQSSVDVIVKKQAPFLLLEAAQMETTPVLRQDAEKQGASPWKCAAPLDVKKQTQVQTILNQAAEQNLAVMAQH